MTDTTNFALASAQQRNAANENRVELLKEIVAFHRSIRPYKSKDQDSAVIALANTYTQMGDWLNEALNEALIEARRALVEMDQIHADILSGNP